MGLQQFLVFAGASAALTIRVVLTESLHDVKHLAWVFESFACLLFVLLSLRAYVQLRNDKLPPVPAEPPEGDTHSLSKLEPPTWNKSAFGASLPPKDYGSVEPSASVGAAAVTENTGTAAAGASADGIFGASWHDEAVSEVIAFFGALLLVFFAETDDRSQMVLLGEPRGGTSNTAGAVLGIFPAVLLAVVCGYLMERQCSNRGVFSLVVAAFLLLTLSSLSQALLDMTPQMEKGVVSLLAVSRRLSAQLLNR